MIAGTLAVYTNPLEDPLEDWQRDHARYPALHVSTTQETHGDSTPQQGTVAGKIDATDEQIYVNADDGEVLIERERVDGVETSTVPEGYAQAAIDGDLEHAMFDPVEVSLSFDDLGGEEDAE